MAIGDTASPAVQSYVAVGKESTFGSYASATMAIEALSCAFRTEIESEKIPALGNRGFSKRVQKNKVVSGGIELALNAVEAPLFIAAALGGGIKTTSITAGGTHSMGSGNFDTAPASLSFNVRKGDTQTWRYSGGRVDNLKISAKVGEFVKMSCEFIFKDSTLQSDNIATSLSVTSVSPFVYVDGVFRYAATEAAAATSAAEERIKGFELSVKNNLEPCREFGTDVLRSLPGKKREVQFKITQNFDTTTSYNRFVQATVGAAELLFVGDSISAEYNNEMTIRLPKLYLNSPDPELGGPDEIVTSEIAYDVMVDLPATTTGRDIGITVRNPVAAY